MLFLFSLSLESDEEVCDKETRRQATHFQYFIQEQGHVYTKMKLVSSKLNRRTTFVFQMLVFWVAAGALKGIFPGDKRSSATDGAF